MNPVNFSQANAAFTQPAEWDEEKLGTVATLYAYVEGNSISSVWMPSEEELADLNNGGAVVLTVWAGAQPPVALQVTKATIEEPEEVIDVEPTTEEVVDPVVNGGTPLDEEDEHDTIEEVAAKNATKFDG